MPAKGVVDIKGKSYKLIVARVQEFNDKHPDWDAVRGYLSRCRASHCPSDHH